MAKKLQDAATIAAATAGLTSCIGIGAVDPAPPPLECTTSLGTGAELVATGSVVGSTVVVMIDHPSDPWEGDGSWAAVPTIVVTGGRLVSASFASADNRWLYDNPLRVEIELDDGVTTGTIRFEGRVDGWDNSACDVSRTFTYTVGDATVDVVRNDLALPGRDGVRIEVIAHDGRTVELRARTRASVTGFEWQVTGGELAVLADGRARWRLPDEPGLYQAELAADFGAAGLAFDALPLEVG